MTLSLHDKEDPSTRHKAMILASRVTAEDSDVRLLTTVYDMLYREKCKSFVGGKSEEVVEEFKSNASSLRTLIVCGRLLEGFDDRSVSVVCIHRKVSRQSIVLFTQFVGRCMRKVRSHDPVRAVVLSHVKFDQEYNYKSLNHIAELDPDDKDIISEKFDSRLNGKLQGFIRHM